MMEFYGYKLVDEIAWVKQTVNGKIAKGMEEAKLYQSMGARDKAYGKMMSKLTIVKSRQAM